MPLIFSCNMRQKLGCMLKIPKYSFFKHWRYFLRNGIKMYYTHKSKTKFFLFLSFLLHWIQKYTNRKLLLFLSHKQLIVMSERVVLFKLVFYATVNWSVFLSIRGSQNRLPPFIQIMNNSLSNPSILNNGIIFQRILVSKIKKNVLIVFLGLWQT